MKSQLRQHQKWSILNFIKKIYYQFYLPGNPKNLYIEKNVRLLRFPKNIFFGNNVYIKENAKICPCNKNAKIFIGTNTTIGYNSLIFASKRIEIGNDCLIAPNVHFVDNNHQYKKKYKINMQKNAPKIIKVGNDVHIGSGSVILPGTIIEDGAVIGAGSVVKGIIRKYTINAGVPAKRINIRK
jgi:acetyltransferase-like isoleucine patch superfamily enzyme